MSLVLKKLAPRRSILFTKHILGTPYLSAWRHTVSDCGSTPATLSKRHMAPSNTLRARSTSRVKSTCPGVSMMLILCLFQKAVVAADVMVIPLSCSCSIQSIVAVPS
uniref:Translation elongation factor G, putative n=1 Tax=Arundo donax TaxID=35708 RepID=A0A0A9DKE7_ARUDO